MISTSKNQWLVFDHGLSILWSFILGPQSYGLQIWLIFDQRSKDRGWKIKWLGLILDLWSFDLWIINHLIFNPIIFGLLILSSLILDHMIHRAMKSKYGWSLIKDKKDLRMKDQIIGTNPWSLTLDPMIFGLLIIWSLILWSFDY